MYSERKQKEVGQVLEKLNLDVVAGQESWERDGSVVSVDGYKWFGKPRNNAPINIKPHYPPPGQQWGFYRGVDCWIFPQGWGI